jgi:hypothetical protein
VTAIEASAKCDGVRAVAAADYDDDARRAAGPNTVSIRSEDDNWLLGRACRPGVVAVIWPLERKVRHLALHDAGIAPQAAPSEWLEEDLRGSLALGHVKHVRSTTRVGRRRAARHPEHAGEALTIGVLGTIERHGVHRPPYGVVDAEVVVELLEDAVGLLGA